MSLPSVQDCKDYLRIENTAEDALLTNLLARAIGMAQVYLGCPIIKASMTQTDRATSLVAYSGGPFSLIMAVRPFDPSTLVVTDVDGTVLDNATLDIDADAGIIRYKNDPTVISPWPQSFINGPYTMVAQVGLSVRSDYATFVEPLVSSAIVDLVADLYSRRTVGVRSESAAGGVRRDYTPEGIPSRICATLDLVRPGI